MTGGLRMPRMSQHSMTWQARHPCTAGVRRRHCQHSKVEWCVHLEDEVDQPIRRVDSHVLHIVQLVLRPPLSRIECNAQHNNKVRYLWDVLPRTEHPTDLHGVINTIRSHFTAGGKELGL